MWFLFPPIPHAARAWGVLRPLLGSVSAVMTLCPQSLAWWRKWRGHQGRLQWPEALGCPVSQSSTGTVWAWVGPGTVRKQ